MTVGLQKRPSHNEEWEIIEKITTTNPKYLEYLKNHLSKISKNQETNIEIKNFTSAMELIENLAVQFILNAFFIDMNWKPMIGDKISLFNLMKEHHIKRTHRSLFKTLLVRLEKYGILTSCEGSSIENPCWKLIKLSPSSNIITSRIKHLQTELLKYPECSTETEFLNHTGIYLYDVLVGKINGLDVLFPQETSYEYKYGAQNLYTNSIVMEQFKTIHITNGFIEIIKEMIKNGSTNINILEIGGGTGGTTIPILKTLSNELIEFNDINFNYTFTDISNFFIGKSMKKIEKLFPNINIEFRTLDIEDKPESQGYSTNSYDIILAADVFHATQYLDDTLTHTRDLLKSNGILILGEIFHSNTFLETTFGLTDGWWRFSDDIRTDNTPLISNDKWEQVLLDFGFIDTYSVSNGNYGVVFGYANSS